MRCAIFGVSDGRFETFNLQVSLLCQYTIAHSCRSIIWLIFSINGKLPKIFKATKIDDVEYEALFFLLLSCNYIHALCITLY